MRPPLARLCTLLPVGRLCTSPRASDAEAPSPPPPRPRKVRPEIAARKLVERASDAEAPSPPPPRPRKVRPEIAARKLVGLPKSIDWEGVGSGGGFVMQAARNVSLGESFTVLGIETSCDDTGVAVVRSDGTILGEAIASQAELHEAWGGVVPGAPVLETIL